MTNKSDLSKQDDSGKKKYQPPKEIKFQHQDFIKRVGEKLMQIRMNSGISSAQVARNANISRNLYHQMENGKVYFTISSLLRILDAHKINASDFFKDL